MSNAQSNHTRRGGRRGLLERRQITGGVSGRCCGTFSTALSMLLCAFLPVQNKHTNANKYG